MRDSGALVRLNDAGRARVGLGASAFAAICWGFAGVFVVLSSAPGLVLTFYRLWLAAAMLMAILHASGRRFSWAIARSSWPGGVLLAGDMAMFFSAVKYTSVVDATVISAVQPALVLIAARPMFGERVGRWDVVWILLAMAGVTVAVVGPGVSGHDQVLGDLLAVGSLLFWTGYWLVSKRSREQLGAMEYTTGVTLMAAVTMIPIVLLSGQSLGRFHVGDILWIFLLTIVPGGGHLAMNWAHRYVDATISSVIGCLSPLVAAGAAAIFLGQMLTALQLSGVVLGLGAIAAVAARHREPVEFPA
jgi:drug/metabolite transporter (DMT)-like permease